MIPINKPMICTNKRETSSNGLTYLEKMFPGFQISLVFSGRQGLNFIYNNLYKMYGSLSVAVSPLTCFEALYPIIRNNHRILFVDINPNTLNMDEDSIPENADIVQPIHFGGNPQNMEKINCFAQKNGQIIVEDCAQAFGSAYNGQLLGTYGTYSVFSSMKNIYALGGGFLLSKTQLEMPTYEPLGVIPTFYRIIKRLLESKNTFNSYVINALLYNVILALRPKNSDSIFANNTLNQYIKSSIYTQLESSEYLIEKRIQNAEYIRDNISNENLIPQFVLPKGKMNYTRLFYVLDDRNQIKTIKALRRNGISVNHLTQDSIDYYQNSVFETPCFMKYSKRHELINYVKLHNNIISLPISPALSLKEMDYIIDHMNQI